MSLRQPDLGHVTQIQTDLHVHLAYCLYTLFITAVIFRKKHPDIVEMTVFTYKKLFHFNRWFKTYSDLKKKKSHGLHEIRPKFP